MKKKSLIITLISIVPALLEAADVEAEVGANNLALTHYRGEERHLRRLRDKKGKE